MISINKITILQKYQEKIMKSLFGNLQHYKHCTKVSKLNKVTKLQTLQRIAL